MSDDEDVKVPFISYTSLTEFSECPKRWYLKRIAKATELPAWWLLGGSAVHTATEDYDRQEFTDASDAG